MGIKTTHFKKILFVLLFSYVSSYGQIINFDGNNCNPPLGDEWGTPDVVDGQDTPTGTADILNFWFDQDNDFIYLAFDRRATGNSSFSFFINTDCSSTTGDTTKGGSDIAAFFAISPGSNPVITDNTLYTWDGTKFVDTGVTFEAKLGEESCDGSIGLFFELKLKISDIFNVCDLTSSCSNLTIEVGASLAGGSPNSSLKDTFTVPFSIGINSIPTAKFSQGHVCAGETVTLDGSNSTFYADPPYTLMTAPDFDDAIVLYEWDFEYSGSFSTDATGVTSTYTYTTPGFVTTALRVTDKYGCTDITTQEVCVFNAPQPKFTYSSNASCGYSNAFDASTSIDPTGGNDLIYEWDFNYDGNNFNAEKIGVNVENTFENCGDNTVALRVTDPTTPVPCNIVIAYKVITVQDNIKPDFTVPKDAIIFAGADCSFDSTVSETGDVTDESDNCDSSLEATFTDVEVAGSCEGERVITRTWSLTDDCGNTTMKDQKINVQDTTDPVWTNEPSDMTSVSCDPVTNATTFTSWLSSFSGSDVCGSATVTHNSSGLGDSCGGTGTETVTFTLTDECGNDIIKEATFTIIDTTDPVWTNEPSDMTSVSCDPVTNATTFTSWLSSFSGSDVCGSATVTHNSSGLGDSCGGTGTETVTFTLTDECGNDIIKEATFTIIDTTDPVWTNEPSDMTSVSCDPVTNATTFTSWLSSFSGSDVCGSATVTHNSSGLGDSCGGTGTETVTFTLTDECGNDIIKEATFTIIDTTDPVWTNEPSDMTSVSCDPVTNATTFTSWLSSFSGSDVCGSATVTHNSSGLGDSCGGTGTETVTFTLTDECGNDIIKEATFTIIDTTDPVWTNEPSDMTSVSCDPVTNATTFTSWLSSFSGSDVCGSATVTHNSSGLGDSCGGTGTETVTFTLTDECGNDIIKEAIFTIIDTTDPVWINEPSDMTSVSCDPVINATTFTSWLSSFSGSDVCGSATVSHNSSGLSDSCGGTGTETVTFTLTDECGNDIIKEATFTIIDTTDPVWTNEPSDMTSVSCDPVINATTFTSWLSSFSGSDVCGSATVSHNSSGLSDSCGGTGTETVTFTLTDECGNDIIKEATFTIIDTKDPVWTNEPSDMTSVSCDPTTNTAAFTSWLSSFSGSDVCGSATVSHNSSGLGDSCGGTGTETVTFTLTDECGNDIIKEATFTIIDTTDPVWTNEPSDMTIVSCDPTTNTAAFTSWLSSFSGSDVCGSATVSHNSSGLSDSCGGTGTETVTFTLTDKCGNYIIKEATFTIVDTTDPVWTNEPSDMTSVSCDPTTNTAAFTSWLSSFSGSDVCGSATVSHNSSGLSDSCGGTGTETVTFTLTDECGNDIIKEAIFTIIDTTDPVWINEPSDMTSVSCDPTTNTAAFTSWLSSFSGSDVCGSATVSHNSSGLSDSCGGTGTETVTFTLTDECGNDIIKEATFTIIDTTDPVWTNEPSDMTSVSCDPTTNTAAFTSWLSSFSGSDVCGSATVTHNSSGLGDSCGGTGTETVTFTLTDECGNDIIKEATFTIIDTTDPVWTNEPSDMTIVSCDPTTNTAAFTSWLSSFSGSDVCGSATVTHNSSGLGDSCGGTGTETVTFTLTDECGNDIIKEATFTIIDTTDPVWTNEPSDMTIVSCDPTTNTAAFTSWLSSFSGSDVCGSATVTHNSSGLGDSCGGTGTETVTFTLTDECGNDIIKEATFTIIDTTDPVWTNEPSDMTSVSCDPATNAAAFTSWLSSFSGSDVCGSATVSHNSSGLSDSCGGTGTETVTFTLTDECGNDIIKEAIFTIIDTTDPVWINEPSDMTSVSCDPVINATTFTSWLSSFSGSDVCGSATVSHNSSGLSDSCGGTGTETVTFTLTDECGNDIIKEATFTIIDTTDPVWTNEPSDMTSVSCDPVTNATTFTSWLSSFSGSDVCGSATVSHNSSGLSDSCGGTGTETVTFTLTDECGNDIIKEATFTIIDTTDPVLADGSDGSAECTGSNPADNTTYITWRNNYGGITATDVCGTATMSYSEGTWRSDGCTDTIKVTFTATDDCGLTSSQDQTFMISDTTAPVLAGGANGSAESTGVNPADNTNYITWRDNFAGITSSDLCGTPAMSYSEGTWSSTSCGDQITVTFIATDECGLTSNQNQTFVISDNTPPALTGGSDGSAKCTGSNPSDNTTYITWRNSFAGITSSDISGSTTMSYSEGTWISSGCSETMIVTFTAEDECGLTSNQNQTFIINDTMNPEITVQPSEKVVECDGAGNIDELNTWLSNNGGAIASDDCSTIHWDNDFTSISYTCSFAGEVEVTFIASDACGNATNTQKRKFIIQDTKKPEFVETLPLSTVVSCDEVPEAVVLTATDNCDLNLIVNYSEEITGQDDDCASEYMITRTWKIEDCAGNITNHSQTLTVEDTKAPTFVESLPVEEIKVSCDAIPAMDVLTATDNCDTDIEVVTSFVISGQDDDCASEYTITRKWSASDCAGNTTSYIQLVTVEDTVAPEFVETLPLSAIVSCDEIPEAVVLTATDNCDLNLTVNYSEEITGQDDDCASEYMITRTWKIEDCAGNITNHSQILTVEDTKAPTFVESLPVEEIKVSCDAIPAMDVLTATDNCDTGIEVVTSFVISGQDDDCASEYTITRKWSASDCAGNMTSYIQLVTVEDTVSPEFVETLPLSAIVSCDEIPEAVVLTATDNCDLNLTVNYSEEITGQDDDCASEYMITRTWKIEDCAGNITNHSQTLTVEDIKAPTFVESLPVEEIKVSCDAIPAMDVLTATDNCDTDIEVVTSFVISGQDDDCASEYTITRKWSASDCAGNTTSYIQLVTVEDTVAPEFVETLPLSAIVSCDEIPEAVVLTATDNCDLNLIVNYSEEITGQDDDCSSEYIITRTWKVEDCAGNMTSHTQEITVEDTEAPSLVGTLPENATVSCDAIPEATVLTATDNCSLSTDLVVDYTEEFTGQDDDCSSEYIITRTWKVEDCAGNMTSHTQEITVEDTEAPSLVGTLPENTTVSCDSIPEATVLTAADNCSLSTDLEVNYTEEFTGQDDDCSSEYIITRTWKVEDCAGNMTSHTQEITVEDTETPSLVGTLPENTTVSCDAIPEATVLTATDNCDLNLIVNYSEEITGQDDDCSSEYIITRTWKVEDCAGNMTSHTQEITVEDTEAPSLVGTLPENATVSCDAIPEATVLTATDNCSLSTDLVVDYTEEFTGQDDDCSSEYIITRTWKVEDCAGNMTSHTQEITVEDTEAPSLVGTLPENTTVSCDSIPEATVLTAADNCSLSTDLEVNYTEEFTGQDDDCSSEYIITRTWKVEDCAGNMTSHTQEITVEDTETPSLVGTLPENTTVSCDAIPEATVLTATDNCSLSTDLEVNYTEEFTGQDDDCSSEYIITRTWKVEDCAGNMTSHTQEITVEDTEAPSLVGTLPENTTVSCDSIPEATVLTATDNCSLSTDLVVDYTEEFTGQDDDCSSEYIITRTWKVEDCAGNMTSHTQEITVEDTETPSLVGTLPENTTVSCDAIPEATVLTATDNCSLSTDLEVNYTEEFTGQDDDCSSEYIITRTWKVEDCAGNMTSHTQEITVEDTEAPSLVGTLPENATVSCDAIPEATVLTATDNCSLSTDLVVDYTEEFTGQDDDCSSEYIITRTWKVEDCAGNMTSHTQEITVEDTEAPSLVGTLPENTTVSCDSIPEATVLTAADNCSLSTDLEVNYTEEFTGQDDDCSSEYIITRTWKVEDCAGNMTSHTQEITVEDTEASSLVGTLPENTTVSCDSIPEASVLTATDNCSLSTDLVVNYTEEFTGQDDDCSSEYIITRTWKVEDCAGNMTSHTQEITVEDTETPSLVGTLPENTTVSCDAIPEATVLTATDNCSLSTDLEVNYTEEFTGQDDDCSSEYTITRTWKVEDCAGNMTSHIQEITVEDTEAPSLVGTLPENATVSCDSIPEATVLTATDNCSLSTDLVVNYTEEFTGQDEDCASNYTITRTWKVEDCAGNEISHTQEIKVEDNEAPELVSSLEDINVECDVVPEVPTLEFSDNCSENVTQTSFEEENTFDGTDNDYQIIRTWTVSDDCGNRADFTQTINVTVKTTDVQVVDSRCTDDGIIELNDYLTDNTSNNGEWVVTTGNVSISTDTTFDPADLTLGDYVFTHTVSDGSCLTSTMVTININDDCIVLPCGQEDVRISKAVTPNGDSWNEFFEVTGVESCGFIANVKIYNRWGAKVFQSNNYTNNWSGVSDGSTFGGAKRLPAGTYYYIVILEKSGLKPITGAIYLGTK